jgi:hypothetical protein
MVSMAGLMEFSTLAAALKAGFSVCGEGSDYWLVRVPTGSGWALAIARKAR